MDAQTIRRYKKALELEQINPELAELVCSPSRRRETYLELCKFAAFKTAVKPYNITSLEKLNNFLESTKKVDSDQKSSSGFDVSKVVLENSKLKSRVTELEGFLQAEVAAKEAQIESSRGMFNREQKTIAILTKYKILDLVELDKRLAKEPLPAVDPLSVFPFGVSIPAEMDQEFRDRMQDSDNAEEVKANIQNWYRYQAAKYETNS